MVQSKKELTDSRGVSDVTGRLEAETALEDATRRLQESEELFRSLFEQSQDGFLLIDDQRQIVAWNPAQERITGLSREQVMGRSLLEVQLELMPDSLRTPAHLEKISALFDKLGHGEGMSAAYGPHQATVQRRDGTQLIVDQYVFPVRMAHGTLVCGLCRNVTEQRRSQEQVAYQDKLLANVNDAVIAVDANGVITAWNRAAMEIFGWTAEEAIGRRADELLRSQDPDGVRTESPVEAERHRGELIQYHRDGRPIPIEFATMPIIGAEGQVSGYVSVNRDISERQQAQQKLIQQSQHLQILHEIDEAILSARLPVEIAEAAAQGVLRVIDATRVGVGLWYPESAEIDVLAVAGVVNAMAQPGTRVAFRDWPWYERAREGQMVIDEDLAQRPVSSPEAQAAQGMGIRSQAIIPLLVGSQVIGHLSLSRRSAGPFADEDLALAKQIADSLAVAIHNAGLLEAEREARQRLETLQAANAALTQSLDLDTVLESLLDYLGKLIPYDTANVMLRTGDAMVAVRAMRGYERWTDPALRHGITFDTHINPLIADMLTSQRSVLVPDTTRAAGWQRMPGAEHVLSWLGVPLVVGGRVLGLFSVDKAEVGFFKPEHVRLAEALAPQAAVAIQNARLHAEVKTGRDQLQALSRRLVELQEEERRALSRDLHDTAGQSITALKLGLGSLKREEGGPEAFRSRIDEMLQLTDTVSEDLHRLTVDLRPSSLDRYGLVPALEQLLTEWRKKTGLNVEFLAQGMEANRLPASIETVLYRIVQEALTNCAHYAQADWVSVMVQRDGDYVRVIVEDDGQGFDVETALQSGRLGLLGMRERAEMLGGTLDIESSPDSGTCIYATVPAHRTETRSSTPERLVRQRPPAATAAASPGAAEPEPHLAEAAEMARAKALTDVFIDITKAMPQYSDTDEFLRLVFARSTQAIGCDDAFIALREDGEWDLRYGYRGDVKRSRVSDLEAPAFAWVDRTRQVLVVDATSPQHVRDALQLDEQYVKSFASVPLLIGDRLLGVLSFASHSLPMAFHPSEVEFLNRLAIFVAFALENARLRESRTRQRDELAQRFEELHSLLDLLPVGIGIAHDPACKDIRLNPAAARMLAVPPGANVSLSANAADRPAHFKIYLDGRELAVDELPMRVAAAQGTDVRDVVVDLVREDGTTLNVLASAVPFLDGQGNRRGSIAAFVDVTEQQRAQAEAEAARQALRQSEERYRSLFNGMTEGFALLEPVFDEHGKPIDYRFLTVNPGFELVIGLKREDVEGRLMSELLPGDDPYQLEMYGQVALTGQAIHFERYSLVLGRWYEVYAYCPAPQQVAVIFTERTERRRAVKELRGRREQYERLAAELEATLSSIADGLVVYDLEGRIVRMNAAAEEMLGYSPEMRSADLEERTREFLQPLRLDGSPFVLEHYPVARALRGETVRNQEMILRTPARAGSDLLASISSAPIRGQDGIIIGCVTTFTDVSELHRISDELRQANQQLQAQADDLFRQVELSHREAELHALSRRLVEAQERERSYVADRLYNEASQVLAVLKMQMGMLERDLKRLPTSTEYLGEMTDNMDRVLRELHRLATHLRPAVLDRLGLAAALHQYLGEFGKQYGVAVDCMTSDLEGIRLPGEVETTVFRVAQEAMANVVQHAQASHLDLSLTYTGTELLLVIHDNGSGFDVQEVLRHGALGLVGMRERAEALGGKLEIESAPGMGTTIIVELPI